MIQKIIVLLFLLQICACANNEGKKEIFNTQLGTYLLDIRRTSLGVYAMDSVKYKNLSIAFHSDSTFTMNMQVPFMYDSIGTWVAGEGSAYDFNQLYFKNFNYNGKGMGEQFYPPYRSNSDSVFLLNAPTPKRSFGFIKELYFIKISR